MAGNTAPIFPGAPTIGIATLTAATPITNLANIAGATPAGLVQLTPVSANGKRVDAITVKGKGTTVASKIAIWLHDGATAYVYDEIDVPPVTVSTTQDSALVGKSYSTLALPAGYRLFVSESVSTDVNVFACGGDY
jgi:hypothetical protein